MNSEISCSQAPAAAPKKRILSAVQPSGIITIGNYLGAVRNWTKLQEDYECFYCVADLHSITVRHDPALLRRRTYETLAIYIACGLSPERNTLFVQSMVPEHTQLSWALSCYTMFGEMSRMTQFKDKSAKHPQNINTGLFTYPVLMAADILLYQADLVPVGQDQLQHLEITRDIAMRFNGIYGDTFKIPDAYLQKSGTKIMSLAEPTKKMSKSDENANASVAVMDSRDDIIRKFKRAVTDSGSEILRSESKPGVSNLMNIYSAFTGKTDAEIEAEFAGRGYGDFKLAVGETVADALAPARAEYDRLMKDKAYLEQIMKSGAEAAEHVARKTLSKVYRKIGFVQPK